MNNYNSFKKELNLNPHLNEKILHNFFKNVDNKIAKSILNDLIENGVIENNHKFGDKIEHRDINGFKAHDTLLRSHNFRDEIESYNDIIKRMKK